MLRGGWNLKKGVGVGRQKVKTRRLYSSGRGRVEWGDMSVQMRRRGGGSSDEGDSGESEGDDADPSAARPVPSIIPPTSPSLPPPPKSQVVDAARSANKKAQMGKKQGLVCPGV